MTYLALMIRRSDLDPFTMDYTLVFRSLFSKYLQETKKKVKKHSSEEKERELNINFKIAGQPWSKKEQKIKSYQPPTLLPPSLSFYLIPSLFAAALESLKSFLQLKNRQGSLKISIV